MREYLGDVMYEDVCISLREGKNYLKVLKKTPI
jgi:hypothetical protein